MSTKSPVKVAVFSDMLCIWAYAAQIKVEELVRNHGASVRLSYHFPALFGDTHERFAVGWADRGGFEGYNQQVRRVAADFDHIEVHPQIWTRNVPASSAGCHLFVKAVQLLVAAGVIDDAPHGELGGRTLLEETIWRLRLAFFRDLENIARRDVQLAVARSLDLPVADIEAGMDSGEAFAGLCRDQDLKAAHLIEGSPTFLLNEGRQKLYGNVGYRIIEANVQELLRDPRPGASWC